MTGGTDIAERLVLASTSPRRRELVQALDMPVETADPGIKEEPRRPDEAPEEYVQRLSADKAKAASRSANGALVLAADTAVVLGGVVLGKPADEAEARDMLRRLRGKVHSVVTGITLLDSRTGRSRSSVACTDVVMRSYSDKEIDEYVMSGEAMDKAGAYAVQDARFNPAERVEGCYLNVVGLPLCEVIGLLEDAGVRAQVRPEWHIPKDSRCCRLRAGQEVEHR